MIAIDLHQWLADKPPALATVLRALGRACAAVPGIPESASDAAAGAQGSHGERIGHSDRRFAAALAACPPIAGWASGPCDEAVAFGRHAEGGQFLVSFEPFGDEARCGTDPSTGTVFSIWPHPRPGGVPAAVDFQQARHRQLAAGYLIHGRRSLLALGMGHCVALFTLDERVESCWQLLRDPLARDGTTPGESVDWPLFKPRSLFVQPQA